MMSLVRNFWVGIVLLWTLGACQPMVQPQMMATPLSETRVDLTPTLATSEWVVGDNRIVFGLLSPAQRLVAGAEVTLQFFYLVGGGQDLRGTAVAEPLDLGIEDLTQTLGEPVPSLYVAHFAFDQLGLWGIRFQATHPGYQPSESSRQVVVGEDPPTPNVGEPAIPVENETLREGIDVSTVTSDLHPDPDFYQMTVAEAIRSGRPTVLQFSSPSFCTSRTCGPALEVVRALKNTYQDRANFIHIEIYNDTPPEVADAVLDWGLRSEPWTFIIDSQGVISARFESLVSYQELEQALLEVWGQ